MATRSLEDLVAGLSAELVPVRRLPVPALRAAAWVGLVAAMGLVLAASCDMPALGRRLTAAPDMWMAVAGSTATAVLAALAAFELSVPGRGARWALLPLPALLLWMSASGLGCLRVWAVPGADGAAMNEARHCLVRILVMSVPLMAAMTAMVRRACPLRPHLTALVSGLAVAAASASLLNLDHPFDASATDLLAHLLALLLVMGLNQFASRSAPARRSGQRAARAGLP